MFSVVLKPLLTNILRIIRTLYQQPMAYQILTQIDGELPSSQHSLNVRKRFVLPLSQSGECSCEHEYLNFALNGVQNDGWIVTIFISVSPIDRPRSALTLPLSYEYITLANAFTNVANAYARLTNVTNAYENNAE